jgi:translation initiation factor IF-3
LNTILVIDPQGNSLGQYTLEEAEHLAEDSFGLDLLEVRPGVYKVVDLGKLKYEASKRRQVKSKALKEMKFKLNIGSADFDVKIGHIRKFLLAGNTVKVTIWFSGREVSRPEAGTTLMKSVEAALEDIGTVNMSDELQGKNMYMTIEAKK